MLEKAIFRPAIEHATPQGVADFFTEVFAAMEVLNKRIRIVIDFSEADLREPITLNMEKGDPVFRQKGQRAARAKLHGRWIAEHDVPLTLATPSTEFLLIPTYALRIKVREWRFVRFRRLTQAVFAHA